MDAPSPRLPWRRLLVPVDGSDCSDRGLAQAIELARLTGAALRVIHVVDELTFVNAREVPATDWRQVDELMRAAGQDIVRRAQARVAAAGLVAEGEVLDDLAGRLPEAVAREAARWHADLVVLGTHGRRGMDRVLMGSGAERIARQSPVPVLLVRPAAAPDEGEPSGLRD